MSPHFSVAAVSQENYLLVAERRFQDIWQLPRSHGFLLSHNKQNGMFYVSIGTVYADSKIFVGLDKNNRGFSIKVHDLVIS